MINQRIATEVSIADLFDQFIDASTMKEVLSLHHRILNYSDLDACEFNSFYPNFKRAILNDRQRTNWRAKALFSKIDKKASHRCYSNTKIQAHPNDHVNGDCSIIDGHSSPTSNRQHSLNNALQDHRCLIIGGGPAGLRTAIELQMLGAKRVVVVEKRDRFSRNNVVHLWPFVIDDLKSLGAKKFYGKFCAGSIDHISIRQLQLILLKICLMIGCDFKNSCSYLHICPSSIKNSANENDSENKKSIETSSDTNPICYMTFGESLNSEEFARVSNFLKEEVVDEVNGDSTPDKSCDINDLDSKECQNVTTVTPHQDHAPLHSIKGTRIHFESKFKFLERELHSLDWDIIIGADGRHNALGGLFPRKEFRGRLAIAITANFVNKQSPAETAVPEISGLSFIYNQDMFNALSHNTNIDLENICYYKDDTHYFVMTAKKKSLLERGVLKKDCSTTFELLSDSNVDRDALLKFAKDAAFWTTGLESLDFATNHREEEDCAMFDFTSMCAAVNACKAVQTIDNGLALFGLVGDSLLEPFWPTGSGCARGFLSSFDAAWMCRQWAVHNCRSSNKSSRIRPPSTRSESNKRSELPGYNRMALSVLAERESIYRILAQTTSENLHQNYIHWTLNPHTRYPNLNRHLVSPTQVEHLILDGDLKSQATTTEKLSNRLFRNRKIKSPTNMASRKSPKKLKSAGSSPSTRQRYSTRALRSSKSLYLQSNHLDLDDDYRHYLDDSVPWEVDHNRKGDDNIFSDIGNFPSTRNLSSIEAKKARDIDECLRQRRQKTQITLVKDQLMEQLYRTKDGILSPGNGVIFKELRRWKEHRHELKENRTSLDLEQPLFLLNSIRRCASFAERVKSFEEKLSSECSSKDGQPILRTQIDNVKNLPQFATFQRLLSKDSALNKQNQSVKRSKIPIMKLTKDDWNVKCWEERLAAYERSSDMKKTSGSCKSLDKSSPKSLGHIRDEKPEKQVEVFKGRIKEMADKLKKTREDNQQKTEDSHKLNKSKLLNPISPQSKSWVNHLRKELTKGAGDDLEKKTVNPVNLRKPIKKLFDDDEDDGEIDVDKHYDHLCINKRATRPMAKFGYTSHLTRTRYDENKSIVINKAISSESKRAYMDAIASRASSRSSNLSDNSTGMATTLRSSSSTSNDSELKCYRCKMIVEQADRITIDQSILHKACLTCANCSVTLRTPEVQHYLTQTKIEEEAEKINFLCEICQLGSNPGSQDSRINGKDETSLDFNEFSTTRIRLRTRDSFLSERVDYNELYKNIIDKTASYKRSDSQTNEIRDSSGGSTAFENQKLNRSSPEKLTISEVISPSPVSVTLPMGLISGDSGESDYKFKIESSETVTLVLPPESKENSSDGNSSDESKNEDISSYRDVLNGGGIDDESSTLDSPSETLSDNSENTDVEELI